MIVVYHTRSKQRVLSSSITYARNNLCVCNMNEHDENVIISVYVISPP